jgi:hypothetical protein
VQGETPKVICQAVEDNMGALEMSRTSKMRSKTKNLNIKYHHFQASVLSEDISILCVVTPNQIDAIFTKRLGLQLLVKFKTLLLSW